MPDASFGRCTSPFAGNSGYIRVAQIVMIGDSLTEDIQGASSVGMPAIWISQTGEKPGNVVCQAPSVREAAAYIL